MEFERKHLEKICFRQNESDLYQSFHQNFYLVIRVIVVQSFSRRLDIKDDFHNKWKYPTIQIDNVRFFQKNCSNLIKNNEINVNLTGKSICDKVQVNLKVFYDSYKKDGKVDPVYFKKLFLI